MACRGLKRCGHGHTDPPGVTIRSDGGYPGEKGHPSRRNRSPPYFPAYFQGAEPVVSTPRDIPPERRTSAKEEIFPTGISMHVGRLERRRTAHSVPFFSGRIDCGHLVPLQELIRTPHLRLQRTVFRLDDVHVPGPAADFTVPHDMPSCLRVEPDFDVLETPGTLDGHRIFHGGLPSNAIRRDEQIFRRRLKKSNRPSLDGLIDAF